MRLNLDKIERNLQDFVENSLMRFPWTRRQTALAQQFVEAMQNALENGPGGRVIAPNQYVLSVHPNFLALWQSSPELLDALADTLQSAARDAGVSFLSPPAIRLATDPALPNDGLRVTATSISDNGGDGTTAVMLAAGREEDPPAHPANAFLIIEGSETFPLRQPVVNIGRRLDNHVILDDARVSRAHAQLRVVRGRYVLFDLNSSGGTYVNGQRITQQTLKPGDVISLAGVSLIYGEDQPPSDSDTTAYYPGQNRKP